jgi:hypothetical protein
VQAPDQPTNSEPASATAERVTTVPSGNWLEQVAPQVIPAGAEVTVPVPAPAFVTETGQLGGGVNCASTYLAASIATVHGPVPLHAPLQPVNVAPPEAVATSVTVVPGS